MHLRYGSVELKILKIPHRAQTQVSLLFNPRKHNGSVVVHHRRINPNNRGSFFTMHIIKQIKPVDIGALW
jgi:hypothetical protein